MKRKLGVLLILTGILFAGWNGFNWLFQSSSGQQAILADDLVTVVREDKQAVETNELDKVAPEKPSTNKDTSSTDQGAGEEVEKGEVESRDYKEYTQGEKIGWLLIPSLDKKYPIYWGTDEDTLTQGVGNHIGKFTTPPDGLRHTVLSGHRDTVFRELGELKNGESMFIQFEGVQYEYKIQRSWITSAEDRTVIVAKDEPVLTLTTCYPFTFLGAAPDRYIIEAPLVGKTDMNP